eukprot:2255051-Amphidinium_carterae.1
MHVLRRPPKQIGTWPDNIKLEVLLDDRIVSIVASDSSGPYQNLADFAGDGRIAWLRRVPQTRYAQ